MPAAVAARYQYTDYDAKLLMSQSGVNLYPSYPAATLEPQYYYPGVQPQNYLTQQPLGADLMPPGAIQTYNSATAELPR